MRQPHMSQCTAPTSKRELRWAESHELESIFERSVGTLKPDQPRPPSRDLLWPFWRRRSCDMTSAAEASTSCFRCSLRSRPRTVNMRIAFVMRRAARACCKLRSKLRMRAAFTTEAMRISSLTCAGEVTSEWQDDGQGQLEFAMRMEGDAGDKHIQ